MRPKLPALGLLLLVALTAVQRCAGLDHGLPHNIEPDALGVQVEYLRGEHKGGREGNDLGAYPMLVAQLAAALFEAPPHPRSVEHATLEEHLEIASKNFLDARRVSLLLSLLALPATFLLARRFVSPPWALFAAALVAFSLLGLGFAQQARPHAPAAALVACTLAAALRLRRRGDTASWVLAGLAGALAVGCLQSAVAVLPAVAAAHLLGARRRLLEPRALIALALVLGAVLALYPATGVLDMGAGGEAGMNLRREGSTLWIGQHNLELDRFDGSGFGRVLRTLWWYEPALLLLLLLAAGAWTLRRATRAPAGTPEVQRGDVLVVLAYLVPYLTVLGIYGETFERFVLPALAPLACFAAWGAADLARRGGRVVATALVLLLVLPAAASTRLAWLHARPGTLEEAASWVAREAPDEPVFLSPIPSFSLGDSSIDLPLLRTRAALAGRGGWRVHFYNVWSRYQSRLPDDAAPPPLFELRWLVWSARQAGVPRGASVLEFLRENPASLFQAGPGVFVVEDHRARTLNGTDILLQDTLQAFGTRLARFSPDPAGAETGFPLDYQDRDEEGGTWPHVTLRCLRARSFGPVLEVWRVAQDDLPE